MSDDRRCPDERPVQQDIPLTPVHPALFLLEASALVERSGVVHKEQIVPTMINRVSTTRWQKPTLVKVSVSMECTAYSGSI